MRMSKMMALYVRDYEEMSHDEPRKTWERIEQKGRACFERQRQRDNRIHTLGVLSVKATEAAVYETAVPGVEGDGKGGKGSGQRGPAKGQQANNTSDPGQWINAPKPDNPQNIKPVPPKRPPRQQVIRTAEQRVANGPCWYYAIGACKMTNCSKEHIIISAAERANILAVFVNRNLPENANGGSSDSQWNNSQSQTDREANFEGLKTWTKGDGMPKGGRTTKGEGKGGKNSAGKGCRFIREGKTCPHGGACWNVWSHPGIPTEPAVDIQACMKASASVSSVSSAS
jgi:hypothetical protein